MKNLFKQAIDKDELLKFALGENQYFEVDREYGTHCVICTWINYVLPLIEIEGANFVNTSIEKMFKELVLNKDIHELKIETLINQLHVYYYLQSENRIQKKSLSDLNTSMESIISPYLNKLKTNCDPRYNTFLDTINKIKSRGGLTIDLK